MQKTRLPQELVDVIIDELEHDRHALATCSLVCHSWLHRTRMHLFCTITLKNAAGYTAFEKFLKRSTHLAHYVRRVAIVKAHSGASQVDRELPRVLPKLPRAEYLKVTGWRANVLTPDCRSRLGTLCGNLRTLSLHHMSLFNGDLMRFILHCPRLLSLCTSYVLVRPDTPDSFLQIPLDMPCGVDKLCVLGPYAADVLRQLLDAPTTYHLRRIVLLVSSTDQPALLKELLVRAGSHLKHFHFVFSTFCFQVTRYHDACAPYRENMLAANTALVTLHISSGMLMDGEFRWRPAVVDAAVSMVLSFVQATHPHLRSIYISLHLNEIIQYGGTGVVDWPEIDAQLVRLGEGRPHLRVLVQGWWLTTHVQRFPLLVDCVTHRLPLFLAAGGKLGIVAGERWEDIESGGRFLGGVRERWYNVTNSHSDD